VNARTGLALRDVALLLLVATAWGVNNVVAKYATTLGPPLLSAVTRFAFQALLLLPFLRLTQSSWRQIFIVALLAGPLHFSLIYTGFAMADEVSPMTVVAQLWIPIATLLAVVMLGERLNIKQVFGIGLAFLGILVMTFDPQLFADLDAALIVFCACSFWALSTVLTRRFGGLPALQLQAWLAVSTCVLLLPASALGESLTLAMLAALPWQFWAAGLFSAITAGIIANGLMYTLVGRYPVSRTTPILLLTPVVSVVVGVLWLGDTLSTRLVLGTTITLTGLVVLTRAAKQTMP
jgi:O-acetylserine/cysteine efflux transporter